MTEARKRKQIHVASESYRDAADFAMRNGYTASELYWLGDYFRVPTANVGSVLWVLGKLGPALAAEVRLYREYRGFSVKYAEIEQKVVN